MHNFLGLGIGIGRFVLILVCFYFVIKLAVKKGIEEYYKENKKTQIIQITIYKLVESFDITVFNRYVKMHCL